ncbi:MAG: hypothetical protein IJY56_00850 [Clostridia bacterium]|nr:hypothetical protein [Clostridia bacterium]
MKQFARSLVSVVIALSILATMCIVGISASAKVHEFVFVSDTAKKDVSEMSNTWATDTNDYAVVNSADLGTLPAGAPATAYRVNAKPNTNPGQTRPGYKALLNGYTTDFSAFKDKAANITVDMWIYVSDVTAVGNLILCLYDDANYGVNYGTVNNNGHVSFTEYNFASYGSLQTKMQNGWNHLQFAAGSFNATRLSGKVVGYSIHEHAGAKGNYTVAIGSLKLVYDDKNAENGVDKNKVGGTIVSATAQKDAHDVGEINGSTGNTGTISVVKTNTLTGGTEGVPSDSAYLMDNPAQKEGIIFPVAESVDLETALAAKSGYLDAWVWIEKASEVSTFVVRSYNKGARSVLENWTNQVNSAQKLVNGAAPTFVDGWNHLVWDLSAGDINAAQPATAVTEVIFEPHGAAMSGFAVACARIITNKADAEMPWDGTDPVVVDEKDSNEVGTTLVSANITKDVANVKPVTSANISVVKTSDLKGGVSGVPSAQAYKSESAWQDGIVFPVDISDETAADIKVNGAYLDAWVHITGVTANNFVFRFFKEGGRNGIGGQVYQLNSWEQGVQKWEAGWYHFVWQIKAGTDLTGVVEMTAHDHGNATVNPAPTSSSFSVAAVRIVPTAADAQKGWGVTSATGDAVNVAMVVVAILLAAMAASVTVYFGKKAR